MTREYTKPEYTPRSGTTLSYGAKGESKEESKRLGEEGRKQEVENILTPSDNPSSLSRSQCFNLAATLDPNGRALAGRAFKDGLSTAEVTEALQEVKESEENLATVLSKLTTR